MKMTGGATTVAQAAFVVDNRPQHTCTAARRQETVSLILRGTGVLAVAIMLVVVQAPDDRAAAP